MKRIIYTAVTLVIMCFSLVACNSTGNTNETGHAAADSDATVNDTTEWKKDPTIGKVQPGYYKRTGIVKKDETYEEMLELRDIESKGYLTVRDDGTATFDCEGEKTEYSYDEFALYLTDDPGRTNGIPYVYIGGRLVVNDGTTITQYLKLTDEELEAYMKDVEKTGDSTDR